jgi:hypothetical protein
VAHRVIAWLRACGVYDPEREIIEDLIQDLEADQRAIDAASAALQTVADNLNAAAQG